ncbi:MAG TPA: acyl-ACP--UDP-N-acetylglucosamine O-acyltransferase [Tepidisphaeraceae bacterium]|nr:acyl-ACP--UDP-N-acetylglucosamine O-acyltransferase [Tepidisphaeraceae bacterium]
MPKISPLACVDPKANLAEDVEVGPFCVVGPHVMIGSGCKLLSHVSITGHTTIGEKNVFHPNSVIGGIPQDLKYRGGPTLLEIGNHNQIREAVTIHLGTEKGGGITRIGSNNLLMVNSHIGHDANLGNHCILANNIMLAGHVVIGDHVAMMGGVGVHHFVTISDFVYIAAYAQITHDIPPFVKVADNNKVRGLNVVGLRRAGFAESDIEALEDAGRRLFYDRDKPVAAAIAEFDSSNGNPHVRKVIEFLRRRDQGKHGRFLEAQRQS